VEEAVKQEFESLSRKEQLRIEKKLGFIRARVFQTLRMMATADPNSMPSIQKLVNEQFKQYLWNGQQLVSMRAQKKLDKELQTLRVNEVDDVKIAMDKLRNTQKALAAWNTWVSNLSPKDKEKGKRPRISSTVKQKIRGSYFYVTDEGWNGIKTADIEKDIRKLYGKFNEKNPPEELIRLLRELQNTDPITHYREHLGAPKSQRPDILKGKVKGDVKILGTMAFGAMAVFTMIAQNKSKFPFVPLAYAGVALTIANPNLFAGQEKQYALKIKFLDDSRWLKLRTSFAGKELASANAAKDIMELDNKKTREVLKKLHDMKPQDHPQKDVLVHAGLKKSTAEFLATLTVEQSDLFVRMLKTSQGSNDASKEAQKTIFEVVKGNLGPSSLATLPTV
jgi:hypothetical protein